MAWFPILCKPSGLPVLQRETDQLLKEEYSGIFIVGSAHVVLFIRALRRKYESLEEMNHSVTERSRVGILSLQ